MIKGKPTTNEQEHFVVEHERQNQNSNTSGNRPSNHRYSLLSFLKIQMPTLLAIVAVELSINGPNGFSAIALIFLSVVVYMSLHYGVRHGLISAGMVLAYVVFTLAGLIEVLSFTDRNFRRISILVAVLPTLAYIVGRLKERNDHLLKRERLARHEAEQSEERLRFMAESMPQKIFTTTPEGKVDYFNPQWLEYTGLLPQQIKDDDWSEIIHPDDVKENIRTWKRSIKTGKPFVFEHRFRRHDGAYHWHITRAHAMRNASGVTTMWVGSSTDIHDIKSALQREHKLEETAALLTRQREQLLELNKAKDEFISLSSHQLRTPATGVKQYIGMLLEGYAGNITDEQRLFLQQAYESNERQLTIVNDLLKVAKVDAGKVILQKQETNLAELIKSILDEQASKFSEREQTVTFRPQNDTMTAMVDKNNLRMVVENIVDNASKYTPPGKPITVSLRRAKHSLRIAVQDHGVGIDKNDIDKIFQKFSRIDNPLSVIVGGSGLGLYWAKKIIDLHEGSIDVSSQIGKGSTFTITLPTAQTKPPAKPPTRRARKSPALKSRSFI